MSDAWNAVKDVGSSVISGIGNGLNAVGDFAGDLFSSGRQPMSGGPDSIGAMMSQGASDIPDIGAASPNLSAGVFANPGDLSTGGQDALSRMLGNVGNLTDTIADVSPTAFDAGAKAVGDVAGAAPGGGGGIGNLFSLRNLIPAATIGYSVYRGMQTPPEIEAMQRMAAGAAGRSAAANAGAIEAMHGNLPGGAQASIDQALAAARARIRSNYAALGMTGSTPEAQDLAYAELAATAQAFQIGQQMAQTGFQAAAGADTLSAQLYESILASETARGTALGNALAEFAAGLVDPDRVLGQEAA